MLVLADTVVLLAGGAQRVYVDGDIGEVRQMVQELVAQLLGRGMTSLCPDLRGYTDVDLCTQSMP